MIAPLRYYASTVSRNEMCCYSLITRTLLDPAAFFRNAEHRWRWIRLRCPDTSPKWCQSPETQFWWIPRYLVRRMLAVSIRHLNTGWFETLCRLGCIHRLSFPSSKIKMSFKRYLIFEISPTSGRMRKLPFQAGGFGCRFLVHVWHDYDFSFWVYDVTKFLPAIVYAKMLTVFRVCWANKNTTTVDLSLSLPTDSRFFVLCLYSIGYWLDLYSIRCSKPAWLLYLNRLVYVGLGTFLVI